MNGGIKIEALQEGMEDIFAENRRIFPEHIKAVEDIHSAYHCFRSFRRASDTRALEKKVGKDDINIVNRWSTTERTEGRRPNQDMRYYYADIGLLKGPFYKGFPKVLRFGLRRFVGEEG